MMAFDVQRAASKPSYDSVLLAQNASKDNFVSKGLYVGFDAANGHHYEVEVGRAAASKGWLFKTSAGVYTLPQQFVDNSGKEIDRQGLSRWLGQNVAGQGGAGKFSVTASDLLEPEGSTDDGTDIISVEVTATPIEEPLASSQESKPQAQGFDAVTGLPRALVPDSLGALQQQLLTPSRTALPGLPGGATTLTAPGGASDRLLGLDLTVGGDADRAAFAARKLGLDVQEVRNSRNDLTQALVALPDTSDGGRVFAVLNVIPAGLVPALGKLQPPEKASQEFKDGFKKTSDELKSKEALDALLQLVDVAALRASRPLVYSPYLPRTAPTEQSTGKPVRNAASDQPPTIKPVSRSPETNPAIAARTLDKRVDLSNPETQRAVVKDFYDYVTKAAAPTSKEEFTYVADGWRGRVTNRNGISDEDRKPFLRLTDAEITSIGLYISPVGYAMNSAARQEWRTGLNDIAGHFLDATDGRAIRLATQATEVLNQALHKLPDYRGTVYRGVSLSPAEGDKLKPGRIVEYAAPTSASPLDSVQHGGNFFLKIESVGGKNITAVTANDKLAEVLFPANTKFEVLSRTQTKSGATEVHLRELPRR